MLSLVDPEEGRLFFVVLLLVVVVVAVVVDCVNILYFLFVGRGSHPFVDGGGGSPSTIAPIATGQALYTLKTYIPHVLHQRAEERLSSGRDDLGPACYAPVKATPHSIYKARLVAIGVRVGNPSGKKSAQNDPKLIPK